MSSSAANRSLRVINQNCAMRRNLAVQPYGRCSVCSLKFRNCHAFRSSSLRFVLILLIFSVLFVPGGWALNTVLLAMLAVHACQGTLDHKATNELVENQKRIQTVSNELRERNEELDHARMGLETEVAKRTGELRDASTRLATANVELIEMGEQRDRLVVDLSHELRTPLASIKGAAQNLLDGIPGPVNNDQREYLEIVGEHADRLIDDAQQIIETARGHRRAVQLTLQRVDLCELVRDVARGVAPAAEAQHVTVRLHTPANLNADTLELRADAPKLRTVVENLIANAIKFTDKGGEVDVEIESNRKELFVRVADTGIGIEEKQLPNIFERFTRIHTDRPGTGVGLALSRQLARMHGGDITASSQVGMGSQFQLCIPRCPT